MTGTATTTDALSMREAVGRRIVDRGSAEPIGKVSGFAIDPVGRRITGVTTGRGRKSSTIAWSSLSGFGPDAVMVGDTTADDAEDTPTVEVHELIGRRCLSELGNVLGTVDDATFDAATGELRDLVVGERTLPASVLRGLGSYACVVAAEADDVHPASTS